MQNFVTLVEKWEEDKYTPKAPSTTMQSGQFIASNGAGGCIPATAGVPLIGVGQETVLSSDVDFTSNRSIAYQTPIKSYFTINIGAGTATQAMVNSVFNLFDAGTLDVSGYQTLTYDTLAVGVFVVGETITGTTSGATGVITITQSVNGSQQLVYTVTSGTFVEGETITGSTSGATAITRQIYANGTQLEITRFISATQVEVKVVLVQ